LFQRAVNLDPNFAMAYARLATAYSNQGQIARVAENMRKAYALREQRVSEREKFYIASHYEDNVTGNLEAARKTYELWAQTYPRDDIPPNNLGQIYSELGDHDKKILDHAGVVQNDPVGALAHLELGRAYVLAGGMSKARSAYQDFRALWKDADPEIPILKEASAKLE
jgi:tetratricopeptide (TPR) repeat protein